MAIAKRTTEILKRLDEVYGTEYICYLNHENPWQLLIAVILSAQCTDARVNIVTKDLFVKYDSLEKFANADLKELEMDIRPTGFFHNKAKNIIACAKRLVEVYGGEVPSELEDLLTLPGVGRKTANVIRGNIYDRYKRQPGLEEGRFGIGLGMVLVRSAATIHGGTVLVDQPAAGGTRVTMTMAIRKNTDGVLRSPVMHVDYSGEWDHMLIELADGLPAPLYEQN